MAKEHERLVSQVLRGMGFSVAPIPVAAEKRADFRAHDGNTSYIVEVKGKEDDPTRTDAFRQSLLANGEAIQSFTVGRTNTLAGIFDDAAEQLAETPSDPDEIKLVWFVASGTEQALQVHQAAATLYGVVQLLIPPTRAVPCYYFDFSKLFDAAHVDAVVLGTVDDARLCVNTFSPRADQLRSTHLYRIFAEQSALEDPLALERAGMAFVADCSMDRRDQQGMIEHVKKKYGIEYLVPLKITSHTAAALVNDGTYG